VSEARSARRDWALSRECARSATRKELSRTLAPLRTLAQTLAQALAQAQALTQTQTQTLSPTRTLSQAPSLSTAPAACVYLSTLKSVALT
jgi:hypothetical protein